MKTPKPLKSLIVLLIAILFTTLFSKNVLSATFTVTNANDSGLGSLRQAILDANSATTNDIINFNIPATDPNCISGVCTISLTTGELLIANNGSLTINGTGALNLIVSGNSTSRVVRIDNNADIKISDLHITEGKITGSPSPFGGAGIRNGSGILKITNSIISANDGFPNGGGIFNDQGTVEITNSVVNSNIAFGGGGVYNDFGNIKVIGSVIDGNSVVSNGGGVFNNEGTLEVINSTLSNNLAGTGGGIRGRGGSENKVLNSTISFNIVSDSGGAILVTQSTLKIDNSTISNNSQTSSNTSGVGGIFSASDSITNITNSTISNNSGINANGILNAASTVNLVNTVLANSVNGLDCRTAGSGITNAENSLIESGLFCVNGTNTNNLTSDPLLGPLADNGSLTKTHLLKYGSPAIDAGDNSLIPIGITNDQRGVNRIIDGDFDSTATTDIGAVEFNPNILNVTKIADTNDGICDADCSLREAIGEANTQKTDDIIMFSSQLFDSPQTISLSNGELININNGSLAIIGTGVNDLTISGNMLSRIFKINSDSSVVMNSFTITNGLTTGNGGGILSENSCVILNNFAIRNSSANNGGGIYNLGGLLTLNKSTIDNNSASSYGGGIYIDSEQVFINSSTVSNNSAQMNGGGIENNNAILSVDNSTISNNSTQANGGGISGAPLNITNSTVTKNEALSGNGGGVIIGTDTTRLRNTIIADNSASANPDVDGTGFISQGHNLIGENTGATITLGSQDQIGTATSPIDPLLSNLGNFGGPTQTHSLLPSSPAIDAADPNNFPPFDQRGFTRPINGNLSQLTRGKERNLLLGALPDIGSFESLGPTSANAYISGRVVSPKGFGISNAVVQITDQNGAVFSTRTNLFGIYKFSGISVGQTLTINVFSKRYQFTTQVINFDDSIKGLDFIAQD